MRSAQSQQVRGATRPRRTTARPLFWRTKRWLRFIGGLTSPARQLNSSSLNAQRSTTEARKGGAVIIVVIALLTSLMLLGIFQFRWIAQEMVSATASANDTPTSVNIDALFDDALRQLIVATPDDRVLSSLNANDSRLTSGFGSQNVSLWSMLAHELGPIHASGQPVDQQLLNGRGITLTNVVGPGAFSVDYDGDGVVDALTAADMRLNFSAMSGTAVDIPTLLSSLTTNPLATIQPDAGYTYPDINSFFLAVDAVDPASGVRVIKPSFTLPRYFANPTTGPTAIQSLRVHPGHTHANRSYLTGGSVNALSGDRSRVIPQYVQPTTAWGAYSGGTTYLLDRDVDANGVDDAVDIDLGAPLMDLAGGRQVVPIYQFKVIDLDGLMNLNTAGNQAQITYLSNQSIILETAQATPASIWSYSNWTHDSNLGLSRSEVNPLFALQANPQNTNYIDTADMAWATAPLRAWVADRTGATPADITGGNLTRLQAANIELARMLYGTPDFFASSLEYASTTQLAGRYGDIALNPIRNFLGNGSASNGIVPGAGVLATVNSPGPPSYLPAKEGYYDYTLTAVPAGTHGLTSQRGANGLAYADTRLNAKLANVPVPPFVHPLDYAGLGDLPANASASYRKTLVDPQDAYGQRISSYAGASAGNSPLRWPQYSQSGSSVSLWENQGFSTGNVQNSGGQSYTSLGFRTLRDVTNLQGGAGIEHITNLPNEMNQYGTVGPQGGDALFSFHEISSLQLSDSDWQRLGLSSQMRKLMPLNFEYNKQASRIRGHFTTQSWDRTEIAFSPMNHANRQWEFNAHLDLSALGFDSDPSTGTADPFMAFPPQFGATAPSRHDLGTVAVNDPFRPEVRRTLTQISADNPITPTSLNAADVVSLLKKAFPRQKLNINRILSDDTLYGAAGLNAFDTMGNPVYRELVPHVMTDVSFTAALDDIILDNPTTASLLGLGTTHPANRFNDIPTVPAVQEWWARYDRQRLARDIYVLLYTLGGLDNVNVTSAAHASEVAREMAQFAVNYVDMLDRDDCVTRFYYDPNLSDGWQGSGLSVVYGVEAQQLTISETLLLKAPSQTTDFATTLHNEQDDVHRWLYMELRNVSPFDVKITEGFRILRLDTQTAPEVPQIAAEFQPVGTTHKLVPAGSNYVLACHDGYVVNGSGQPYGSAFVVDYTGTADLDYAIPKVTTPIVVSSNNVQPVERPFDFDLTEWNHTGVPISDDEHVLWNPIDPAWATNRLVDRTVGAPGTSPDPQVTFSLQRRMNPHIRWATPAHDDNEWIEVDRVTLSLAMQQLNTADPMDDGMQFSPTSNGQTQNAAALALVKSQERLHHFTYKIDKNPGSAATPELFHSMHANTVTAATRNAVNDYTNATTITTMPDKTDIRLWQPHFDRDYSSAMELLSIPLYGLRGGTDFSADPIMSGGVQVYPPDEATPVGGVTYNMVDNSSIARSGRLAGYNTAMMRFQFPSGAAPTGHPYNGNAQVLTHANRWYRLFNFIDIPETIDDVVKTQLQYQRRVPGRVQLNTIRHEAVLAGLIDDDVHFNGITANAERPTTDKLDANRNWMQELLYARDRDGLTISGFNVVLPGSPLAKPFRPAGWVDPAAADTSEESSLVRNNANYAGLASLDRMGLFEARQTADYGVDAIDTHTRNRLLAKVANNSTVRSHVYGVWVGFDLHEAHQSGTQVQIGGKATDLPGYRMFCVVDMSRLEEAYDPVSRTYDFRKFILDRKLLP